MEKQCLICNKIFNVKPSQEKRRKTCSKECLKKYKSIQMSGQGNHQFGLKGNLNNSFINDFISSHIY